MNLISTLIKIIHFFLIKIVHCFLYKQFQQFCKKLFFVQNYLRNCSLSERKMNDSYKSPNGKCLEKFEFVKKFVLVERRTVH